MEDERFFNAPVVLYVDFMKNSNICLNNVFDYAVYQHSLKLTGTKPARFMAALEWFNLTVGNINTRIENGQELTDSILSNSPKVGISRTIWYDFIKNEKSDFDKICLLAYLAIKSIINDKPYFKLTNNYWLARMDGKSCSIKSLDELSEEIRIYSTEYQLTKIKKALRDNWGLTYYGKNVRGFYVSNSLTIEQLVLEVFKSRQKKVDNYTERIKEAEIQALKNITRPFQDHNTT